MRKLLMAIAALAVTAAVVVGIVQAGDSDRATTDEAEPLSLAEVSRPPTGAPPALVALRVRANVLVPGGADALDAQLRKLRGNPVVVNLWASWCDPCRYELPFLQRQAIELERRVAFLGVNSGDNRGDASRLTRRIPLPYPSIEDPRQAVAGRYGAPGLPATAFYDERGKLVLVHQGVFPTEAKLAAAIDRYAVRGGAS